MDVTHGRCNGQPVASSAAVSRMPSSSSRRISASHHQRQRHSPIRCSPCCPAFGCPPSAPVLRLRPPPPPIRIPLFHWLSGNHVSCGVIRCCCAMAGPRDSICVHLFCGLRPSRGSYRGDWALNSETHLGFEHSFFVFMYGGITRSLCDD